jgi:hypothetical protein
MNSRRDLLSSAAASLTCVALARACAFAAGFQPENPSEVLWLSEIQSPPKTLPKDAPVLAPLCQSSAGVAITHKEDWLARRAELLKTWLEFLGPMPADRARTPKLEILEEERIEEVVRQRLRYEIEPGLFTEAYLCKPLKQSGRTAGIVAFHSTVNESIRQPAGVEGAPEKAFGLKFARQGKVVICPRNFLWPDNTHIAAKEETERLLKRHPRTKGMAKMLFDGLVAVDILASLPEVDPQRLGAVGHSLGAKEVLYLAAFDERIKVAVCSEGGIGVRFSNWEADWYLGAAIEKEDFRRDHHELLALIAPRPFLLIGGESADGDRGWPFIAEALKVYELYGRPCRIGQFNHRKGHAVPPEAEQRFKEWIDAYL